MITIILMITVMMMMMMMISHRSFDKPFRIVHVSFILSSVAWSSILFKSTSMGVNAPPPPQHMHISYTGMCHCEGYGFQAD